MFLKEKIINFFEKNFYSKNLSFSSFLKVYPIDNIKSNLFLFLYFIKKRKKNAIK